MVQKVSYEEQTLKSPNPFTRFAHQSRYKVSLDLSDDTLPQGGTLCDFGAGEGTFLNQFGQRRPDAKLIAIEPYMTIKFPQITRVERAANLDSNSIDLMTAFETLEHVTDQQLDEYLEEVYRVLKPNGRLLVTVPIMYGLTLPVKEVSRSILHRRSGDTGLVDMMKATAGMPIERAPDRLISHRGFDFRALGKQIGATFAFEKKSFSPFANLPWWLNSQAVFVAHKMSR